MTVVVAAVVVVVVGGGGGGGVVVVVVVVEVEVRGHGDPTPPTGWGTSRTVRRVPYPGIHPHPHPQFLPDPRKKE